MPKIEISFVTTPFGKFEIFPHPKPEKFQFEPTSGYFYDSLTRYYFDKESGYFYCSKQKAWKFYSWTYDTYIPCQGEDKDGKKKLQLWELDQKKEFINKVLNIL
uniref:OCRE domain-containing protein n=1 Tax=Acrobeloides nanus TaxID=290746 RepID=A0A914ENM3_9BILA